MKKIASLFGRTWGVLWLAIKRLRSAPELTFGVLVGLVTVVTLTSSIPMYVEAANNKVLSQELGSIAGGSRPAFSFMYLYSQLPGTSTRWADIQKVDQYIGTTAVGLIGLPLEQSMLYVHSNQFSLFPSGTDVYSAEFGGRRPLSRVQLGFVRELQEHVDIVDGQFAPESQPDGPIEVIIAEEKANELGLHAGDEFILYRKSEESAGIQTKRFEDTVRIAGIWRASDPSDSFWFLRPEAYKDVLLLPEHSYIARIVSDEPYTLTYAGWYQVFDGSLVEAQNVTSIMRSMERVRSQLAGLLRDLNYPISPAWALTRYQRTVSLQTKVLLTFSIPLILLALGYVIFVSSLSIRQQRLEIALLKSRGSSTQQVVLIYLFQSLVLGAIGFAGGLFLGRFMAQLIGQTRGFLSFGGAEMLRVRVTRLSLQLSGLAIAVATLSNLLPAFRWARLTVVTFKQFFARMGESPWWRKYYVDILLLGASMYGLHQLRQQGSLPFLLGGQGDPLQNPLLLLAPTLFVISMSLVFIRFFPLLMDVFHWISRLLPGTVLLLSSGRLSRSANYNGVLLLLMITVGLSVFTASLAKTLDSNVSQRAYYNVGADVALEESVFTSGPRSPFSGGGAGDSSDSEEEEEAAGPIFIMPSSEAEKVPGVRQAARVASFGVTADTGQSGRMLTVERTTLPQVAFFRSDFASRSLGALMNELAVDQRGALVNREYLAASGLGVGDIVTVRVNNAERTRIEFVIAGILDLFPTVYPDDSRGTPLYMVTNISYVENLLGYPITGQLWLSVDHSTSTEDIVSGMQSVGFRISSSHSALDQIAKEQGRMERVGLFGFLSVGFMVISFLSMLGLMIYAFISLRQWTIQFGVLRAIGLTANQLVSLVVLEQLAIVLLGIISGAGFGIWMSYLFLPFLQVSYAELLPVPPLLVQIAWDGVWRVYSIVGIALLLVIIGMIGPLRRIRMFEAIKMGEAESL